MNSAELTPESDTVLGYAVTTLKNRMLGPTAKLFIESAREIAATLAKTKARETVRPRPKG